MPLLLRLLALALAAAAPAAGLRQRSAGASALVVVPLHLHERVRAPRRSSFLAVSSGTSSLLEHYRARHNNTHAIEYYGYINVGNQSFSVIFDTGSDSLILPGADCISPACKNHQIYNASRSRTSHNLTSMARQCQFGTGTASGYEREERACIGQACADVEFVEALLESDDPFARAKFDGVLGLSLGLRKNASTKASVLEAMAAAGAIPRALFAVFLSKDMHMDASELSLGQWNPARADGPFTWVPLSEPGYWQFSLKSISVGGAEVGACAAENATLEVGASVTSYFGKMCCREVDEFEYEDRCQFWGNASDTDDYGDPVERSRYMDSAKVVQSFDDGRVAVRLHDGCLQKVPRKWLALADGCRGDGTIQAVLDTGSSLMMAPEGLTHRVMAALGVKENCTAQAPESFPKLTLTLPSGANLTLGPSDYMDTVVEQDGVFCWPHLMPFPATAKGPVFVLGMPFLRTFYTAFDAGGQRVGFAVPKQPAKADSVDAHSVGLRGSRPGEADVR